MHELVPLQSPFFELAPETAAPILPLVRPQQSSKFMQLIAPRNPRALKKKFSNASRLQCRGGEGARFQWKVLI